MVATPVHTAPLGDPLTRDRVRSGRDSRIVSSRGPLWGVYHPADSSSRSRNIYELVADPMSMIIREKSLPFVGQSGNFEDLRGIGGTSSHIWIVTSSGSGAPGTARGYLYDLAPKDFSVQRRELLANIWAYAADGDDDILYVGFLFVDHSVFPATGEGLLRQINTQTLAVIRSVNLGLRYWPHSIAGDQHNCWLLASYRPDRFSAFEKPRIRKYNDALSFMGEIPLPLYNEGHRPASLGGGSKRIYYETTVSPEDESEEWPAGGYLHTIKPSTFEIVRTYGPFVSDKWPRAIGGK